MLKLVVCGSLMRRKSQSHSQFSFRERFFFRHASRRSTFCTALPQGDICKKWETGSLIMVPTSGVALCTASYTDRYPACRLHQYTHTRKKKASKLPPCCAGAVALQNPTWANAAAATASSSSPFVKCIIFYTPSSTAWIYALFSMKGMKIYQNILLWCRTINYICATFFLVRYVKITRDMIYAFLFMKSIMGHELCAKNTFREINNNLNIK